MFNSLGYGIDIITECDNWERLYNCLPDCAKSAFFSPQYYQSSNIENSTIECFWAYQNEQNYLFYPYLVKSINILGYDLDREYFDVSGAYGYNGPLGVIADRQFLQDYNSGLESHLLQRSVVTELVRYCPITGNRVFHTYTEQTDVLDNVFIDLSRGLDWIWNQSYEYGVRKAVRKAEAYGLQTRFFIGNKIQDIQLRQFYNIYLATMNRKRADDYYYFPLDFFQNIVSAMQGNVLIAITYLEGTPISAELVLLDGKLAFGFLGGTLGEYYKFKANTFQRHELIKILIGLGISKYSMGGSAARGDSIYTFKRSFAKDCVNPFYIGTKVHLPDVYSEIRTQWAEKYPGLAEQHSGKLQGYRIQA